jgi:hypothetical protein
LKFTQNDSDSTNNVQSWTTKGCGSSSSGSGFYAGTTSVMNEMVPPPKSNRLKDSGIDEFPKPYSLDVTPECQKFIAKKLTKALDR